ncbi:hypothetical protein T484DRAFT_1786079 [Baffinella frigidus]|nr:hypothetical protein T484DRAFT_1786079 [Cryptophyta sp. CCMP2293]
MDPPVFTLPLTEGTAGLAPGAVVRIPLWLRAQRPGAHQLRLLLHCTPPEGGDGKMRYRHLQVEASLVVEPSVRCSVHLRASASSGERLVLAVEVDGPGGAGAGAESPEIEVTQDCFILEG